MTTISTIFVAGLAVTILPAVVGASLGFGIALGVQAARKVAGRE